MAATLHCLSCSQGREAPKGTLDGLGEGCASPFFFKSNFQNLPPKAF